MKKISMLLVSFILLISLLDIHSVNAAVDYRGGLLDGQPISYGPNYGTANYTYNDLTDNMDTQGRNWQGYGGSNNDVYWYKFSTPVVIDSYRIKTTVSTASLVLRDSAGAILFRITIDDKAGGLITFPEVQNVTYVSFENTSTTLANVYELNVYYSTKATQDTTAGVTVGQGTYSLTAPTDINFGTMVVSPNSNSASKALGTIEVSDLTGRGQGWRLQVQSSPLTDGTNQFPTNSLNLSSPLSVAGLNGTTSPPPTIASGYPWFIDAGSDITILTASLNEGMGTYAVDFTNNDALTITVPQSAIAGTYSTTIHWKVVVGP